MIKRFKELNMLKITNLSYGFPDKELYNDICFTIDDKEHAVLVGSNGTGKSTLINIIMDDEKYMYDGKIEMDEGIRIGYVPQYVTHAGTQTVYDFLAEPFVTMQSAADKICEEMATAEDMNAAYQKYQECIDEIEAVDGYNFDTNIRKNLSVAGLDKITDLTVDKISGGEYKLISIIKNMLLKPQLLIMDEPDVFLDFENLVGFAKLINQYEGAILAITHNRLLLNQCFNKVLHLENMELQEFPGTFEEYNLSMLETKVLMQEQASKEEEWIETQKKLVEKLRKEATRIDSPAKGKQLKARVTYLERLQERKTPNPFIEEHDYEFSFTYGCNDDDNTKTDELEIKDYSLAFDRTLLENVSFKVGAGDKIAIVGANGTGKSSMLNDIYNNYCDKETTGFFTQIYSDNEQLSGGEKNLKQLRNISKTATTLLLLDEPTSHLDTYAQLALEKAIDEYEGAVVMVSHDFFTVCNCANRILLIEDRTIRELSGRAFRKMIYKNYFDSDIFEKEKKLKEKEITINNLLKSGKIKEAKDKITNLTV